MNKEKSKSEVIRPAKKDGRTVHFANLMDLCYMKYAELAKHLQKCKGLVVLREDNVKDEEGLHAEQCSRSNVHFQSFLVWLEKQATQFQRVTIAKRRMA